MKELNKRVWRLAERFVDHADEFQVAVSRSASGTRIVDCGVQAIGGLRTGLTLAKICMADLGRVRLVHGRSDAFAGPAIDVHTDHPVAACMASQYAGWQIKSDEGAAEDFFAMGSGPMRAAYGGEPLFDRIGFREQPDGAVGVLESARLPPDDVCRRIAERCGVSPSRLVLLVAKTSSLAGTIQIVARSLETCLHKMHELDFDLTRVVAGFGIAPLPPIAADDLIGIGWTNDAVLYGGEVTLWLRGDDAALQKIGPQIPSSASPDHGQPFAEIFARYDRDFYKIDPLLFSPAAVTLVNIETGWSERFGNVAEEVLRRSFARR